MSRPWKQHCIVLLNSERQFAKKLIHSLLLLLIGFSIKIVPVNFHKHSISKLQINLYRENRGIFDKNRLQIQDQFTYKKERICVLVIFSYYLSECSHCFNFRAMYIIACIGLGFVAIGKLEILIKGDPFLIYIRSMLH